ncbi:MAG: DUF6428 family protein [Verrucomicrobiota bacterium]
MNHHELLSTLASAPNAPIHFRLPDGDSVPAHFHITEVAHVQKNFIDCGGTTRSSITCQLQAWVADDQDHRITTDKLAQIIRLATPILGANPLPVELEYEDCSISQFPIVSAHISPEGVLFLLSSKHTDCLAKELCGIPTPTSENQPNTCNSSSGCC